MPLKPAMERPARLLVVEDDQDLGSLLEYVLGSEGFRVTLARTGENALATIARGGLDLIVLDLMLPDMSGLDILRKLRGSSGDATRVIILSAKGDEADRLTGFELGADDYVAKPFSPRELVLRIRKALELKVAPPAETGDRLSAGPIAIDFERHEVRVDGAVVQLTLTEFKLLAEMMRNVGRVRTRDSLMSEIRGYDSQAMSRAVDTHVRRLRAKLGPAAAWIDTVRGLGYRIKNPRDRASG